MQTKINTKIPALVLVGANLNPFEKFTPKFSKQYYWWDNATYSPMVRLKIVHPWDDGINATQYEIRKNTDAYYEIYDVYKTKLVNKIVGEIHSAILEPLSFALNYRVDRLTFNGTTLKYSMNKSTSRGILRAILQPGTFRGSIYKGMQTAVNTDKAEGYYYFIQEVGDYTTLGINGCSMRDIVQYSGGTWHKYTESEYPYQDTDCYSSTSISEYVTILSNLPVATYNVGIVPSGLKNTSSSGVNISPILGVNFGVREFAAYGGTFNGTENTISLTNNAQGHCQMSTRFRKNGTVQAYEWIPEHQIGAQLNYHESENMHHYFDGVELVGNQLGDQEMIEFTNYTLINEAYACNDGAALEELMKVTTTLICDVNGFKIKNKYEALIETQVSTAYSYMMRYSKDVFTQYVSDRKEQIALPAYQQQVITTDGNKSKKMFFYNNTVGGDYENLAYLYEINDTTKTNRNSELPCFLSTYGVAYGKFYCLSAQNEVWAVGSIWETETIMKVGYVPDLISKTSA